MAAVTKVELHPAEVVRAKIGKAAATLVVGDPVVIDAAAAVDVRYPCTYKKAVAEEYIDGIVLKNAVAGGPVEVMIEGEMEGYSGLTPAAKFTVAAGAIDTTARAAGVYPQLRAVNATRIDVRI
jgi:hypothetical protein